MVRVPLGKHTGVSARTRKRIHITGIVQGVGFRPFVYNLANKYNLKGYCLNDSEGVLIEVEGEEVESFIDELSASPPPLSKIESLTAGAASGNTLCNDFSIRDSLGREGGFTLISPDIAPCPDCLRELFDPGDRRYLYPFINCTNCGPRYSIIQDIPYDRPNTTMSQFRMCLQCGSEYLDPHDRRFHAQPNACPECGPQVELMVANPRFAVKERKDPIRATIEMLKQGAIVAVKGLGGFHLCCNALNHAAATRLREKKRRSNKPFAIMTPDINTVRSFCSVSDEEGALLEDRTRPIVILDKNASGAISEAVAPGNRTLGVMLPYTPLHYLLFYYALERHTPAPSPHFTALVMTSGNLSGEPIVISNKGAEDKLSSLADAFLVHNRDIYMRVDDPVVKVEGKTPHVFRRARGFVPMTIDMGEEVGEILACGADLKNTFCLTKGRNAILSQHIGYLDNYEAEKFFTETLNNLKKTFRVRPRIIAHDMHPDYLSASFARDYALQNSIPDELCIPVQHHHAHIAGCMAEHGLREEVIGVAFDGTGYGQDGNIWGGEFLIADRKDFTRKAHFGYVPLPGGDSAVKEPWRTAISYLYNTFGDSAFDALPQFFSRFGTRDAETIIKMITGKINAPLTSSAGRLFDAVSSVLGLRDRITFEGEAAIDLEMAAYKCTTGNKGPYPYEIQATGGRQLAIDVKPMIKSIAGDLKRGTGVSEIAYRFHYTLADIIAKVSEDLREESGIGDVVMSGGVFQNSLLLGAAVESLTKKGFRVWTHGKVPANDGGISLGQAAVAWERTKEENI